jgi:quercetin dioxygenase-like cupin family protein
VPRLYFASPRDLPTTRPQPGVTERVVKGADATLLVSDLDALTVIESHKHDEEHLGMVTRGSVAMVIAGEQRILTSGDTYVIPAGAAHGTRVLEQAAQVIDVSRRGPA